MANFARIIDGCAVDVSTDPTNDFHPDLVADFVVVPADVAPGWRLVDSDWVEPAPIDEPSASQAATKVSPVEFKLLFNMNELEAIDTAKRAGDVKLRLFFEIIDDPRLTFVDLELPSTKDGLAYLVALELITEERRDEILTGVLQ